MVEMAFREWIKTEIETPPLTEDRCKSLEEVAWVTLLKVKDEIMRGERWRYSPEVVAVEEEIRETYQAVVAGGGSLKSFSEACEKWKRVGTLEAAQVERNISTIVEKEGEHHGSA